MFGLILFKDLIALISVFVSLWEKLEMEQEDGSLLNLF